MKRKTAKEKLHIDRAPSLADNPPRMAAKLGPGKMLIPTPLQVDALIREIPAGQTRTTEELRTELAKRHGAVTTCPLCFGIFWRLSAEAAEEDRDGGHQDVTPYWRVIKPKNKLNEKLPGGMDRHRSLLEQEGVTLP